MSFGKSTLCRYVKARAKSLRSQSQTHRLPSTVEEKFEAFLRRPTRKEAARRQLSVTFNNNISSSPSSPSSSSRNFGFKGTAASDKKRAGAGDKVAFKAAGTGAGAGAGAEDGDGMTIDEFTSAYRQHGVMRDRLDDEGLAKLFTDATSSLSGGGGGGRLTEDEFTKIAVMSEVDVLRTLNRTTRNVGGGESKMHNDTRLFIFFKILLFLPLAM